MNSVLADDKNAVVVTSKFSARLNAPIRLAPQG